MAVATAAAAAAAAAASWRRPPQWRRAGGRATGRDGLKTNRFGRFRIFDGDFDFLQRFGTFWDVFGRPQTYVTNLHYGSRHDYVLAISQTRDNSSFQGMTIRRARQFLLCKQANASMSKQNELVFVNKTTRPFQTLCLTGQLVF